eukprot:TRINITY_DN35639_c0_g2_i1.p2 TRINITY_DN35639_c0_g2~~TRINITY_DN35639_c0_g2_i1.p2  ORF type:complete len:256 (+),score=59.84 TRINITY_DN35639_c0_g2_i1:198-965(+)
MSKSTLGLPVPSKKLARNGTGDSTEPLPKGRKIKGEELDDDQDMEQLLGMVGRLALAANGRAGAALSINTDVLVYEDELAYKNPDNQMVKLAQVLQQAGREYSEQLKTLSSEQKGSLGPPYVRIWDALVGWCLGAAKAGVQGVDANKVNEEVAKMQAAIGQLQNTQDKLGAITITVRYCKNAKAYKKGLYRLEVGVVDHPQQLFEAKKAWGYMLEILVKLGAQRKMGPAPLTNNARQVVKALKSRGLLPEREERE